MSELIDDWYDYTNQKALRLPPVGSLVEYCDGSANVYIVGYSEECQLVYQCEYNFLVTKDREIFRPLDWNRKAETERKRVVDAAYKVYSDTTKDSYQAFIDLYDLGMLRMPEDE